jgi:hypothetical protein
MGGSSSKINPSNVSCKNVCWEHTIKKDLADKNINNNSSLADYLDSIDQGNRSDKDRKLVYQCDCIKIELYRYRRRKYLLNIFDKNNDPPLQKVNSYATSSDIYQKLNDAILNLKP